MWKILSGLGAVAFTATLGLSGTASFAKDSANVTMFGADAAFILPRGAVFAAGTLSDPRGGIAGNDMDGDLRLRRGLR